MATGTKVCKICGKEYECCQTNRRVEGVFRWQDVACCVEHAQEYLDLIVKSRTPESVESAEEVPAQTDEPEVDSKKKVSRRKAKVEE